MPDEVMKQIVAAAIESFPVNEAKQKELLQNIKSIMRKGKGEADKDVL